MTIIDQLEKALTPVILGDDLDQKDNVAAISLLEQFYALLIARLASADIYSQLLRNQALAVELNHSLFEQLWPNFESRQLIINELSITHHIDDITTKQLVTNTTHLAYQELQNLANSQFLPAFLQSQQATIRQYLPVWASTVILAPMPASEETLIADVDTVINEAIDETTNLEGNPRQSTAMLSKNKQKVSDQSENIPVAAVLEAVVLEQGLPKAVILEKQRVEDSYELGDLSNIDIIDDSSAIHANSSAYRTHKGVTNSRFNSSWLIPLLLLVIAVTALALLWFLVIQPKYMQPVVPVVVEPIVIVPETPTVSTLLPIELTVAVDDSGGLYSCNATVGDVALQQALQQALNTSFAEQSSICELTVQQGVATTISAMDIGSLPEMLALVRSVPFARLQLRDNRFNVEAPDEGLLQQLLVNIRTLLPNVTVTTIGSMAPVNNNNQAMIDSEMSNFDNQDNNVNSQFNNEFTNTNNNSNNSLSNNRSYQQSDDDTNDQVVLAPPRNNASNVNNNNIDSNNSDNRNQSAGTMSLAEAENLANSSIVAEPLRNARPVDKNIGSNN